MDQDTCPQGPMSRIQMSDLTLLAEESDLGLPVVHHEAFFRLTTRNLYLYVPQRLASNQHGNQRR